MVISTFFASILAACGYKNTGDTASSEAKGKTTYKYDNSSVMQEVKITKSVYSDGQLKIYISDLGDNLSVVCFDGNFQCLDGNFDFEYKKGKLIIKGEEAEKISGLNIKSSSYQEIKIRYLDSNQYAILVNYFVDDLGIETYGDLDAYYSEEEKAAQQAAKDERQREQDENYTAVEGYWESVEDNGEYVYIFTDENGARWLRQAMFYNDQLSIDDTYVHTINISEICIPDYYAYYRLEILDSDGWGCCYQFDLNQDMTAIVNASTGEAEFIKREGMTPGNLAE